MSMSRQNHYFKESDEHIIRWAAEYAYLQPRHVQLLASRHIIAVRRRLRQLHQRGLFSRTTVPFARNAPLWSPPDQYVYYLSREGLALARHLGFSDQHVRYNPEKSAASLPHDLFLTTFHLALYLATEASGTLHLDYWEQRRAVLQDPVRTARGQHSFNPDALFSLRDTAKPPGQNTTHFFLEYERSRPTGHEGGDSNFIRKMRGFIEYHQNGCHAKRWGIPNFYVLTITPTKERALNLCYAMLKHHLRFRRFWFTDASQVSLERPSNILHNVFLTPRDLSTRHPLHRSLAMRPLKRESP